MEFIANFFRRILPAAKGLAKEEGLFGKAAKAMGSLGESAKNTLGKWWRGYLPTEEVMSRVSRFDRAADDVLESFTELPKNIKISAYEEIFAVHQAGIQGVNIEYVARPPVGISVKEKAHYFKVIKEGRFWDKIVSKNNIAFFIASEFKSLQMELVLLL